MSEEKNNGSNIFADDNSVNDDINISEELEIKTESVDSKEGKAKKNNQDILSKILENKVPIFIGLIAVCGFLYIFIFNSSNSNTKTNSIYPSSPNQMMHIQQEGTTSNDDPLGEIIVPELEEQLKNLKEQITEEKKQLLSKDEKIVSLQKTIEELANDKKFLNYQFLEIKKENEQLKFGLKDIALLKQTLNECVTKQEELTKTVSNRTGKGVKASVFKINTIYSNQAWIQDASRTYVVTKGDVVHGLEIKEIDAKNRKILTSNGVIR